MYGDREGLNELEIFTMLNFVKNAFSKFMEVILWINFILCAVGGWFVGNTMGRSVNPWTGQSSGDGHAFLGVLAGVVVGVLTNIICGGFIATILNIDRNLENLLNKGIDEEDRERHREAWGLDKK